MCETRARDAHARPWRCPIPRGRGSRTWALSRTLAGVRSSRPCRRVAPLSESCAIVAAHDHDGGRFRRWRCLQPPPLSETCAIVHLAGHHGASFRPRRKKTTMARRRDTRQRSGWTDPDAPNPHSRRKQGCRGEMGFQRRACEGGRPTHTVEGKRAARLARGQHWGRAPAAGASTAAGGPASAGQHRGGGRATGAPAEKRAPVRLVQAGVLVVLLHRQHHQEPREDHEHDAEDAPVLRTPASGHPGADSNEDPVHRRGEE